MIEVNKMLNKFMSKEAVLKYKKILCDQIIKIEIFKNQQLSFLNIFDYFNEHERGFFESVFIDNKSNWEIFLSKRGFYRLKNSVSTKIFWILYKEL